MKTPYTDIFAILKLNRLVSISISIGAFLAISYSAWLTYSIHNEALNNAFAVDANGNVLPLTWENKKDHLNVEVLAHLDDFHRYFYDLESGTYEKHIEKALWLGDQSVSDLYQQKKADGVYNRLLQYSLVQQVTRIQSEIDLQNLPIPFRTTTIFKINRGGITDTYKLITSGKILRVERHFPKNPHGMLITDFYENSLQKVTD